MVFNNLGETVKGLLNQENKAQNQEQNNMVEEEFAKLYSDEVIKAVEDQNYSQAEELLTHVDKDFDEFMGSYIEHRISTGSAALDYFENMTDLADEKINEATQEIGRLHNKDRRLDGDKMIAKQGLDIAKNYIGELNRDQASETMRKAFESFHKAAQAADYIGKREDLELEDYRPEKVKLVAGRKVSKLQDLDREMGMDFKVEEYNDLVDAYNQL